MTLLNPADIQRPKVQGTSMTTATPALIQDPRPQEISKFASALNTVAQAQWDVFNKRQGAEDSRFADDYKLAFGKASAEAESQFLNSPQSTDPNAVNIFDKQLEGLSKDTLTQVQQAGNYRPSDKALADAHTWSMDQRLTSARAVVSKSNTARVSTLLDGAAKQADDIAVLAGGPDADVDALLARVDQIGQSIQGAADPQQITPFINAKKQAVVENAVHGMLDRAKKNNDPSEIEKAQKLADRYTGFAGPQTSASGQKVIDASKAQGVDPAVGLGIGKLNKLIPPQEGETAATAPSRFMAVPDPEGLITPGNIDLYDRPRVPVVGKDAGIIATPPAGTVAAGTDKGIIQTPPPGTAIAGDQGMMVATVRSITITEDGKAILIPTVSDAGKIMSDQEAIDLYHQSGKNLGVFKDAATANKYAEALHQQQAAILDGTHPDKPGGQQVAYQPNSDPHTGLVAGASLRSTPMGMQNNNPLNIKNYQGAAQRPGYVGPSHNTDEGDPQAVYATAQDGMNDAARMLVAKNANGLDTVRKLINADNGWTPNNPEASVNVARMMGISPDDKVNLKDPAQLSSFLRALATQEQGPSSKLYDPAIYANATNFALHGNTVTLASTKAFATPGGGSLPKEVPGYQPGPAPANLPGFTTIAAHTDQTDRAINSQGYGGIITGSITVNGNTYKWVSGGQGRGSLPFGTYKVQDYMTGPQRKAAGYQLDVDSFMLADAKDTTPGTVNGPPRTGLLIHDAAVGGGLTAGCIGINGDFGQFQKDLLAESQREGGLDHILIHVGPDGATGAPNPSPTTAPTSVAWNQKSLDQGITSIKMNTDGLKQGLGTMPTPGEIYLAESFGVQGALKIIQSEPTTPVEQLLSPEMIQANPQFKGMTGADVMKWATTNMQDAMASTSGELMGKPLYADTSAVPVSTANTLNNEIESARRSNNYAVTQQVADDVNSIKMTGKPVIADPSKVAGALTKEENQKYVEDRADAQTYYSATNDFYALSPDEMQARINNLTPKAGQLGYTRQAALAKDADTLRNQVLKDRADDPAKSVANDPDVKAAVAGFDPKNPAASWDKVIKARYAAENKVGIPADVQFPLTKTQAQQITGLLGKAKNDAEFTDMFTQIGQSAEAAFGSHFDEVLNQLVTEFVGATRAPLASGIIQQLLQGQYPKGGWGYAWDALTEAERQKHAMPNSGFDWWNPFSWLAAGGVKVTPGQLPWEGAAPGQAGGQGQGQEPGQEAPTAAPQGAVAPGGTAPGIAQAEPGDPGYRPPQPNNPYTSTPAFHSFAGGFLANPSAPPAGWSGSPDAATGPLNPLGAGTGGDGHANAVDYLRAHPETMPDFIQIYGPDAVPADVKAKAGKLGVTMPKSITPDNTPPTPVGSRGGKVYDKPAAEPFNQPVQKLPGMPASKAAAQLDPVKFITGLLKGPAVPTFQRGWNTGAIDLPRHVPTPDVDVFKSAYAQVGSLVDKPQVNSLFEKAIGKAPDKVSQQDVKTAYGKAQGKDQIDAVTGALMFMHVLIQMIGGLPGNRPPDKPQVAMLGVRG